MWCDVMWCGVVWCDVVCCAVMWCDVVWCGVCRFQEQLVLLVKGVQVLKMGLRAVELEDASLAEGSALTPEVKAG